MGFLLLAFNQISNNCGMLHYTSGGQFKVPMVVRGPGGVGRQLGAEHSQRLESYFQSIPGGWGEPGLFEVCAGVEGREGVCAHLVVVGGGRCVLCGNAWGCLSGWGQWAWWRGPAARRARRDELGG